MRRSSARPVMWAAMWRTSSEISSTKPMEKRTINTNNILLIMSGAFNGLEELIQKRLNREGIGFGAEIRSKDERAEYLIQVKAEDLIAYGFESEFIGRAPAKR